MALTYRTLWLSDVHLGTPACRAADLLDFLSEVTAEKVYLAGDIIDLERLRVRPRFPEQHRQVLAAFVQMAAQGSEVLYIPGNHDSEFRDLAGRDLCGVPVKLEAEHRMKDGKRLLVIHGDVLDGRIRENTNLKAFGAAAYGFMMQLDALVNRWRSRLGHDHLSISRHVKERLASANEYIRRFEDVAADYAASRGFDGVVCGHIHRPAIRSINGVRYANDGDWVEHGTALAETLDGRLELLRWARDGVLVDELRQSPALAA